MFNFTTCILLFIQILQVSAFDNAYEKGLSYLEAGEINQALNYWVTTRDSLTEIGKSDFRIGVKFIDVATKNELENLYPLASEMYLWALQPQEIEPIQNELLEEVNRLKYIIPEDQYEQWHKFIENRNSVVLAEIKGFWRENNPVYGSSMNERLIEHWERLAYIESNFQNNSRTELNSDDRGIIYLRYGAPDDIHKGRFTLDNSRIQFYSREILRQQDEEIDMMGQDRISRRANSGTNAIDQSYYLDNLAKSITDRVISYGISNQYEIWTYSRQKVNLPENLIFIFGTDASTGLFSLLESPEDFIPQNAFRLSNARSTGYQYNLGPLLQLSIYNDLKFTDDKFLDIYNDLSDRLMSNESIIEESSSTYLMNRYSDELIAMRNAAPPTLSIYDQDLDNIQLTYDTYQFYDDDYQPYNILVLYSSPQEPIIKDYTASQRVDDTLNPTYILNHQLVIFNNQWEEINTIQDYPEVSFENELKSDEYLSSISLFRIPHLENKQFINLYAQILNRDIHDGDYNHSHNLDLKTPRGLIATGELNLDNELMSSTLLDKSKTQFSVSDLVFGYRSDFDIEEEDLFIPFFIPKNNLVINDLDIHFMFEVYNIPKTENGHHEFQVEYEVVPERQSFINRVFRSEKQAKEKISLTYEVDDPRWKTHLSVDISDYNPGKYSLILSVFHEESEKIIRETEFEVAEK